MTINDPYTNEMMSERLRAFRKLVGVSLEKMSLELEQSIENLGKIEKGESEITPEILYRLREQFGLNPRWILFGEYGMFLYLGPNITPIEYIVGMKVNYRNPSFLKYKELLMTMSRTMTVEEVRSEVDWVKQLAKRAGN